MNGAVMCRETSEPEPQRRIALLFVSGRPGCGVITEVAFERGEVVLRRVVLECIRMRRNQ